nr:MAG TPA: hypothetical protein [Caudoviricetes sp.]
MMQKTAEILFYLARRLPLLKREMNRHNKI